MYLAPHGVLRYTEFSRLFGLEVQSIENKWDAFPDEVLTEINMELE